MAQVEMTEDKELITDVLIRHLDLRNNVYESMLARQPWLDAAEIERELIRTRANTKLSEAEIHAVRDLIAADSLVPDERSFVLSRMVGIQMEQMALFRTTPKQERKILREAEESLRSALQYLRRPPQWTWSIELACAGAGVDLPAFFGPLEPRDWPPGWIKVSESP